MPLQAVRAPAVELDADLRPFNTFGLPARARYLARIECPEQVAPLLADTRFSGLPRFVLGGGSNIVLTSDVPGLVLQVAVRGRECVDEDAQWRYVRAGGGENWHDFVRWTLDQGWPGLENLSLIPGTVGAAPVQNIGAYGLELAERFDSLEAVALDDGSSVRFSAADCRFAYRDSVFKREAAGRYLITAVIFRLPKTWEPQLAYAALADELAACAPAELDAHAVSDAVIAVRSRKLPDPARLGNAGSFFKNPVVDAAHFEQLRERYPALPHYPQDDGRHKIAAGWLIEQCGWKGRNLGGVGCYERQALVLVNRGGAQGEDVRHIASAIQQDVIERFGVVLEPEPIFI